MSRTINSKYDINQWDFSKCTNTLSTTINSNYDISQWDISKVIDTLDMFTPTNFYKKIIVPKLNIPDNILSEFSYDKLVCACYYSHLEYILKYKEQCVSFDLFYDIGKNTENFDIFLLTNNNYIQEKYIKLTEKEKNLLILNEHIAKFFTEIESVINFNSF